jgi:hypothetical protein
LSLSTTAQASTVKFTKVVKVLRFTLKTCVLTFNKKTFLFFEKLKQSKVNTSLGFIVDMNNRSEVKKAEKYGYDAIEM